MATTNPIAEALRQMAQGEDFWSADDLTRDLSPDSACRQQEGSPYSIATVVGHMLFWQDRWLRQIEGEEVRREYSESEDFPTISPDDWMETRARLIGGIELAESMAAGMTTDREAGGKSVNKMLLQIALHNSYHIGQIALLRQINGLGMPTMGAAAATS